MKQRIEGRFVLTSAGIPFFGIGKIVLTSTTGNQATGRGLILGPLLLGFWKR